MMRKQSINRPKKTGEYAVTTVRTISWLKEPVIKKDNNKRRSRKKDVVYPLFADIVKLCKDEFWVDIFTKCSQGDLPKGFEYKNGEMYYRHRNKVPINNNYSEALVQLKEFFQTIGNIMSPNDIKLEKIAIEERKRNAVTINHLKWKDIRSASMKETLIMYFVRKMVSDKFQQYILYDRIKNGFTLKYITSNDVSFAQGEIKGISGLVYDGNKNFVIDSQRKEKKKTKPRSKSDEKTKFSHSYVTDWEKLKKNNQPTEQKKIVEVLSPE